VPTDGYIADVKVVVDKATGLVGEMAFVVKSDASLVPTNVVTCGTHGGVGVSVMPKLAALAGVTAACKPAQSGRRLHQLGGSGVALDPVSLNVTVTTVTPYRVAPAAPINVSNSLYQTNSNSVTLTWTDGVPLGECFGGGWGGVETGARAPPQIRPSLSRLPLAHVHHQVRGARRRLQRGRGRHAQRLPSCFAQRDRQGGHDECAGVQVRRLLRPGAELPGLRVLAGCPQRADDQHTEL
jgi:hypothetical protein